MMMMMMMSVLIKMLMITMKTMTMLLLKLTMTMMRMMIMAMMLLHVLEYRQYLTKDCCPPGQIFFDNSKHKNNSAVLAPAIDTMLTA